MLTSNEYALCWHSWLNELRCLWLWCCWNAIQKRLNSWQDGVSATNCPIQPGKNWDLRVSDQGQNWHFLLLPHHQLTNACCRIVIAVPFPQPEAEFDLLIGDWFYTPTRWLILPS
ncbi:hypothetical protein AAG906_034416 [Vitis piasezkii]